MDYEKAAAEIVLFDNSDVITTSGIGDENQGSGCTNHGHATACPGGFSVCPNGANAP